MVDMGAAVAEVEDSMVGTLAVVIEVGTMEDSMVDTMVGIEEGIMVGIVEDTTVGIEEGTMVEVSTHIGDYGDFGDGPMLVGPTIPMEDTHI